MIEVACEACGWIAITSQPVHQVWAEHEATCPAVGGAVRHMVEPEPRYRPRLLPPVVACKHRPVRRQIAVTPSGTKLYTVACELCGRLLEDR
jgi:hypothetical protein